MLLELSLANFAVIGRLMVRFGEGLNIITGETGTGKSIIVEAVNVVLGAKASGELVKTGQSEAHVEALFSVRNNPSFQEKLDSLGYGDSEDELIIKRIIPRKGRGRVYINGSLAVDYEFSARKLLYTHRTECMELGSTDTDFCA